MNFIGIGNARYVEPTETLIDLELETDEGIIPFTFDPSDNAPATEYVRERISTLKIAPYIPPPLEEAVESEIERIARQRWYEKMEADYKAFKTELLKTDSEILAVKNAKTIEDLRR